MSKSPVTIQAGAMQWMAGDVNATTGIREWAICSARRSGERPAASPLSSRSTRDQAPLVLEPTYKYLLLINVGDWGGSLVLEDGYFLACESSLKHKAVMRSNCPPQWRAARDCLIFH